MAAKRPSASVVNCAESFRSRFNNSAAPDPRDPAVMGHERMDTPEKLAQLLAAADFAPAHIWRESYAHAWTVDALFAMQSWCGLPSRRLASLPEDAREVCRERVRSRFAALPPGDLVHRMEVLFAVARRPC